MLDLIPALAIFGLSFEPVLSQKQISLSNRQPVQSINEVFKKNILLNLKYMDGKVKSKDQINWDEIAKPFTTSFRLYPGQTFAFHDDVLPEYKKSLVKTTNAHFNAAEGFLTDGYLYGDGVCHLASIIYWAAYEAGLQAAAPTDHDFTAITDVPKQYGVSIYNNPYSKGSNQRQNLYITNNRLKPVTFVFEYKSDVLKVTAIES